jgi:hypothetical protein
MNKFSLIFVALLLSGCATNCDFGYSCKQIKEGSFTVYENGQKKTIEVGK